MVCVYSLTVTATVELNGAFQDNLNQIYLVFYHHLVNRSLWSSQYWWAFRVDLGVI